ncbi:carbohydrate ABC transporter permease [Nocardiopsis alba]|uniref:Binding--dependent transport system inner membrane component family protein n=1 Tax=Nocardiopsis alba (strain ATCC BAA-2165 / BE74) TaxID=1205910 RepID=J7LBV0_NOCAA|nr:carbohydrate ABC transporter permease [Nocardiopsis alba]AFR08885.1 binding--dependent transport system inner membrane component family protein [Nocardiopsis alba ATCC BAA-2165]
MTLRRLGSDAAGLLVALVVALPLYWMVLSALKPRAALEAGDPTPYTLEPTLESFRRVLLLDGFGQYLFNSLLVAVVVVTVSTLCAFLAAVALTRYRFRLRTTLLIMILTAQMVPVEALTIPLFFLMRTLGYGLPGIGLNKLGSLMLVHTAFAIPLAVWMLRSFVAAVPKELEEAAWLDGAGSLTFVTRVLFPLVAPGVVACSIFSFIMTWNDFLFARTFIISAQENQTLPIALLSLFKPDENDWGGIMAGSVLMTLPVLVFFLFVQRRLANGLGGAVKG